MQQLSYIPSINMPRPGQKTRQEAARMWALGQSAEKNQKRLLTLASPQTQMLASWKPSKSEPALGEGQGPDIQRRMSAAFDRLEAEKLVQETATKVDSKTTRQLGKLVLEFEQVNNNLLGIQKGIKKDIRERNKFFDKKKKLQEKEEKELKSLKGAFFGFRARVGAISGAIALKELAEGDVAGAVQPAAVAVASFLPEIVNITSSVVLGGLALRGLGGGRGRVAATAGARAPRVRGGGRAGLLLGAGGLALGAAGMGMLGGGSEERRQELVAQATAENTIAPEDVNRFSSQLTRFNKVIDLLLQRMNGKGGPTFTPPKDKIIPATYNPDRNPPMIPGGAGAGGVTYDGKLSGDAIAQTKQLLRDSEGFRTEPYWDVNAWRIGYGSDTITDANENVRSVTTADRVTREEAELDLERRIKTEFMPSAANAIGDSWSNLPPSAQAALTSVTYNYGSLPSNVVRAAKGGNLNAIADAVTALQHHNAGINRRRRLEEASIIRDAQKTEKLQSSRQPEINTLNVPGQTQTVAQAPPQQVESQSTPYIDTNYPSNDRFASNLLLGAFA